MFFEKKRKTCVAIVPAAGSSTRMKEYGDKLFMEIDGIPIIVLTLLALQKAPEIDAVVVSTREDMISTIKNLCEVHSLDKVDSVVSGGKTRTESVLNGILSLKKRFDLIAIHDAARPFVSPEIIKKTVSAASFYNAAAPAVPVKDTIKQAKGNVVEKTIPRDTLFAIQTPQIFDSAIITAALTKAVEEETPITDDCSAAENIGMRIFLTEGDHFNIKITTPEDILFAEAISRRKNERGE